MKRRLSQEKLGELADTHRNYIGKIERGEVNVTADKIVQLAKALKTDLRSLLKL